MSLACRPSGSRVLGSEPSFRRSTVSVSSSPWSGLAESRSLEGRCPHGASRMGALWGWVLASLCARMLDVPVLPGALDSSQLQHKTNKTPSGEKCL